MPPRPQSIIQRRRQRNTVVFLLLSAVTVVIDDHFRRNHKIPRPMHTSVLTGLAWLDELLHGHPQRFKNQLGMAQHVFHKLSGLLQLDFGLSNSKFVTADEQLAIFLYYIRSGCGNRTLQERFQRSGDTISRSAVFAPYQLGFSFKRQQIYPSYPEHHDRCILSSICSSSPHRNSH